MAFVKRLAADMWFSKCIREAAGWRCQRCGKQHHEGSQGLHCAHFITRGKWATRFDPLNVASCCYGCHQYLDSRPYEKAQWFEEFLGMDVAQMIREKSENTQHGLKKCLKEITKHYKAEHARIVQANRDGVPKVTVVGYL